MRKTILAAVDGAGEVVPPSENSGVEESRYKTLGGEIAVIHKQEGYHPHSLKGCSYGGGSGASENGSRRIEMLAYADFTY